MADQYKKGQSGFLKNLVNKLPYQSLDFNKVLGDLNPKYNTFEDTGMRRVEALAKNSIFYNNEFNNHRDIIFDTKIKSIATKTNALSRK